MRIFNVFVFLLLLCFLYGCEDKNLAVNEPEEANTVCTPGMQHLIFNSVEELEATINQMGDEIIPSRSIPVSRSYNDELFVSLVEANRQAVYSTFTAAQLDSIANDEDDLEWCPSDSIIADIQFAQLLNKYREIQVADTVYRYFSNGVAYAPASNSSILREIDEEVGKISQPTDYLHPIYLSNGAEFKPIDFHFTIYGEDEPCIGGGGGGTLPEPDPNTSDNESLTAVSTSRGIELSNGIIISGNNLEDVSSLDGNGGDGNWWNKGILDWFGVSIVSIIKFEKNKKLTLNFYDQDYYIYANVGVKLKMQKKVCGIWWNIKAEEMILGWENVAIKYTLKTPLSPQDFVHPDFNYPTIHTLHEFPYTNEKKPILHIPFTDYDLTNHDLGNAFKSASNYAFNYASSYFKNKYKVEEVGLMFFQERTAFTAHGPYSTWKSNCRSVESKLYSKWFPNTTIFTFSLGSTFKLKGIDMKKENKVELYQGRVFGAIKFNGQWKAGRIAFIPDHN